MVVTGAAGFAGGHLVDQLASEGESVVAWHRPGGSPPRPAAGVRWEPVDILDASSVTEAISAVQPSVVYHCAGAAHVGRSWQTTADTLAVNVRGTHRILEALRRSALRSPVLIPGSAMVYASVDGPLNEDHPLVPGSPYAVSKLAQEMLGLRAGGDGLPVFIARAFNHFGPRQDAWFVASGFGRRIADVEAGRWDAEITVGNLEARRDLTDVRDTVRAYRLIVERGRPGRAYNVCTGHAVRIRDLLDLLLARARVPIRVRVDPARYRPNDVPLVLGDPARIRDEIGWAPKISLEQSLDDLLAYWRQEAARASEA